MVVVFGGMAVLLKGIVVLCRVEATLFGGMTVTLGGMVPLFGEYGHYIWGYVGGMFNV